MPSWQSACGADAGPARRRCRLCSSAMSRGRRLHRGAGRCAAGDADAMAVHASVRAGRPSGTIRNSEFLGAGGISEVYRARDTRLGRTVALKLVTDPQDRQAGSRLFIEAQHASILNHPNICGVHEAEDVDGLPFIVLELVEGPTLRDVLKGGVPRLPKRRPMGTRDRGGPRSRAPPRRHPPRSEERQRRPLTGRWRQGPRLWLVAPSSHRGRVPQSPAAILTDASVAGTLTHIAPEVLRGEPLDPRVDLWALGVMLYEMASGVLPFKRTTAFETAEAILNSIPEALPATVPVDLRRIIERCLAKDPDARFATAAELRDALHAVPSVAVSHRAVASARAWAAAVAALLVVAVAGALYLQRRWPP